MEVALGAQLLTGAGAGLSSLATGSTALTVLQGGMTAASALSSIRSGNAKADQLLSAGQNQKVAAIAQAGALQDSAGYKFFAADFTRDQAELSARSADLEASQEYIAGRAAVTGLREDLARKVGSTRVGFAAAGVDPTSGTAARRADYQEQRGAEDIAMAQDNSRILQQQAVIKAGQIRAQGGFSAFAAETEARQALAQAGNVTALGDATLAAAQRSAAAAQSAGQMAAFGELGKFGIDALKRK